MWWIFGLGNPGTRYRRTRHNAGFLVVDEACRRWNGGPFKLSGPSLVATAVFNHEEIELIKPQTFMNRSGLAIREALGGNVERLGRMIVAYDDFHLPLGRLRIRERGSSGGHRGVESILETVGTREFVRLRLGIAEEQMEEDRAEFVLRPFPSAAADCLESMVGKAVDALESIILNGVPKTMSVFN